MNRASFQSNTTDPSIGGSIKLNLHEPCNHRASCIRPLKINYIRMKKLNSFLFLVIFLAVLPLKSQVQKPGRILSVDYSKEKGEYNRMFAECIGAGRANEGLRADWQEQLRYVKEQCGFKYIRMHGLLTDDMGVYFEDKTGKPIYNWQYVDKLFDFLLSINMKPFVELGFMPRALASGNKTIFWWNGNVTPPKDYDKWAGLIKNMVLHFKERYGHDEVKTWYFEVWNEPNLKDAFFTGDQAEYFKLYKYTANAIKEVSADYRVGGPSTAGNAWIPEFINFCYTNKVAIDFVSTHTYGVKQGYLDVDGSTGTILNAHPYSVSGEIIDSRKQINTSPIPGLELHYTEWSSSYTPSDPMHDSYHQAAYILEKIKKVGDAPKSMSYWVFTDIFEEAGPRTTPFHGGFGLLNYQSINKPAFYSYQFLNRLGNKELENNDASSWACKDENGNIQILFWDFTVTHPGDTVNNQVYYKRELPSKDKGSARIVFNNVPAGSYVLDVYKVGYRVNDAYTTYLDLGSPSQLSLKQEKVIKQKNAGQPVSSDIIKIESGKVFQKDLPLRENDVYLLVLNKM
jgi:xylan 1,4-beta-xylosidase